MRVLGIETSCDETAVSVVEDGRRVLTSIVSSQVELHSRYGGVVPEVASRQHVLSMLPIYRQALDGAGVRPSGLDAIAVTRGPGLAGALLVGLNFAKGLAVALGLPLIGVNHLEGHVYAQWLEEGTDPAVEPGFPLVVLLVSGGHTELLLMEEHGRYRLLGLTRDDSAGEAFDKAARVLGLGFPGGPEIQRVAAGVADAEPFPSPMLRDGTLDFSFSGLKTALLHRAQASGAPPVPRFAAGFQRALVEVLVVKTLEAARRHNAKGVLLGGGVAANAYLREQVRKRSPVPVLVPRPALCTDNGAMIAGAAFFMTRNMPLNPGLGLELDAVPGLRLG
ncbi:MAG: tRNA (adenosine(37)-N6)-threonylcarbamoyltransferase complex transferase subunit TsaD [Dehalococcoidia bacterium]|nr:tRNA (adenosine(37)-N6)-threonylcarbamoyltransferase complex transferase subunit TsaD [Dehalococcoidia bacterium]